jgi:ADP-ribose pyrophosphatase YjhB (NUDIX family)
MDVEVEVGELLGAYEGSYLDMAIVTLVYLCSLRAGDPRPADLIDEVRWFPIATLPKLASASSGEAISELGRHAGI